MVQKFMDAANILKAKFKKDELEQSLVQATSEQNWQTPTNLLHQISNAAYNYQKCQQILQFLFDKLKKKPSWRKVLKSLNLVQFLLKNGPPNLVGLFKQQQYTIKSLQDYSHMSDNIDRGQSIRERAKAIVQLLNNQQILQQQRTNAKNIRQKMSGIVTNYGSGDSKYKGYDSKNYNKTNTKTGFDNNNKLNSAYGDYTYNKSTLDKYKDKQQKKTETNKIQPNKNTEKVIKNIIPQQQNVIQQNKKPFQKQAPKLGKPGQKKSQTQTPNIIEADFPQESKKQEINSAGNDIFDFVEPPKSSQITNSSNTNKNLVSNPVYPPASPLILPQASQAQSFDSFNFNKNNLYSGGQNTQSINLVNPMYSTTAPMAASNMPVSNNSYDQTGLFSMQLNTNNGFQSNLGPANPVGGSPNLYQQPMAQQSQNSWNLNFNQSNNPYMNVNPATGGSGAGPLQFQGHNQAGISLGAPNKSNDQFGDFNSGQKSSNKAGWLSENEKGLIDFSDFGKQLKKPSSGASNTAASNVGWDW